MIVAFTNLKHKEGKFPRACSKLNNVQRLRGIEWQLSVWLLAITKKSKKHFCVGTYAIRCR